MKGEIYRLCKDIESCEQAANHTKAELLSHSRTMKTEFQQTIDNLKKQAEENIQKLSNEKVHIGIFVVENCYSLMSYRLLYVNFILL